MESKYTKEIREDLVRFGIMPKLRGFIYLIDAIEMAIEDRNIICGGIINIYKKIGMKYNVKWQSVERSMRYAVEKNEYEVLEERFDYVSDVEKIKVMDFILLIAGEF